MISLDSAATFFRKIAFLRGKLEKNEFFFSTILLFSDKDSFFVIKKSMETGPLLHILSPISITCRLVVGPLSLVAWLTHITMGEFEGALDQCNICNGARRNKINYFQILALRSEAVSGWNFQWTDEYEHDPWKLAKDKGCANTEAEKGS
jgi:hypothetical protein